MPSMRLFVKPHQPFFRSAGCRRGRSTPAASCCFSTASVLSCQRILFPPPPRPSPNVGVGRRRKKNALFDATHAACLLVCGGERSAVGRRVLGPGGTPGRPSIRVEPAKVPSTCYRVRPWRSARLGESPPIERTAPLQATRRQNGGSLRPCFPTAATAAAPALAPYEIVFMSVMLSAPTPCFTPPPPGPASHGAAPSNRR